jgi:hypothetical protein
MPTDKKLILAILVLAGLGGAVYLQRQKQGADLAAHSLESAAQSLPKITITDDDIKKVDKVELTRSAEAEGSPRENIVLVKKSEEDWALEKPVAAKANASSVKSMVDDIKRLEVKELIDSSKDSYAKYKVTDDKALHAVFYKGKDVVLDAYFGEDGSRGQMTRIAGKDGVFAVKGYSSYLFNKDGKSWRDKTIFKFEEKDVTKVSLENENGTFSFEKSGEDWKAKHAKPKGAAADLEKFDKTKLEGMVRAYKTLSAADYADGKKPEETGIGTPKATITFEEQNGAKHVIVFGNAADGTNRWAKKIGADETFSVSSWAGDWATANVDKFAKTEEKKDDKKGDKKGDKAGDKPKAPSSDDDK